MALFRKPADGKDGRLVSQKKANFPPAQIWASFIQGVGGGTGCGRLLETW